jgi:hypothetical protein
MAARELRIQMEIAAGMTAVMGAKKIKMVLQSFLRKNSKKSETK